MLWYKNSYFDVAFLCYIAPQSLLAIGLINLIVLTALQDSLLILMRNLKQKLLSHCPILDIFLQCIKCRELLTKGRWRE